MTDDPHSHGPDVIHTHGDERDAAADGTSCRACGACDCAGDCGNLTPAAQEALNALTSLLAARGGPCCLRGYGDAGDGSDATARKCVEAAEVIGHEDCHEVAYTLCLLSLEDRLATLRAVDDERERVAKAKLEAELEAATPTKITIGPTLVRAVVWTHEECGETTTNVNEDFIKFLDGGGEAVVTCPGCKEKLKLFKQLLITRPTPVTPTGPNRNQRRVSARRVRGKNGA